jgi:hypothetical protein
MEHLFIHVNILDITNSLRAPMRACLIIHVTILYIYMK